MPVRAVHRRQLRCNERFESWSNGAVWRSMLSTCLARTARCAWTAVRSVVGFACRSEQMALASLGERSQHDATVLRRCCPALGPSSQVPLPLRARPARVSPAMVRLPRHAVRHRVRRQTRTRSATSTASSMAGSRYASVLEGPLLPREAPWVDARGIAGIRSRRPVATTHLTQPPSRLVAVHPCAFAAYLVGIVCSARIGHAG